MNGMERTWWQGERTSGLGLGDAAMRELKRRAIGEILYELEKGLPEYPPSPECPKCNLFCVPQYHGPMSADYYLEGANITPEHIQWNCECGYSFFTKTKDAK